MSLKNEISQGNVVIHASAISESTELHKGNKHGH